MALSEFETKRCERVLQKFMDKRRPPVHLRDKLDFGFCINGQSVEIFEIRPVWDDPDRIMERSFAKATFVKSRKHWTVFWKRADLKWHRYDPNPVANSIDEFVSIVDEGKYACFFG